MSLLLVDVLDNAIILATRVCLPRVSCYWGGRDVLFGGNPFSYMGQYHFQEVIGVERFTRCEIYDTVPIPYHFLVCVRFHIEMGHSILDFEDDFYVLVVSGIVRFVIGVK